MDLLTSLRAIYEIEASTVEKFEALLKNETFSKGQLLIRQGSMSNHIFLVKSGVVRCFYVDGDTEATLHFGVEGNFLGSLASIVKGEPSLTSYEAVTDVEVYAISHEDFWKLCSESPDMMRWHTHYLYLQLYALEKRSRLTRVGDAYTRYQQYIKLRGKSTIAQIPLKYISQYLNISQETLSRIRNRIARGE